MSQLDTSGAEIADDQIPPIIIGQDEMNLADFPFVRLGRNDTRCAIVYEGWVTDKDGQRIHQRWEAQGGALVGLPTEFDQRVYTVLMYLTEQHGLNNRKVPFSFYELEKLLGMSHSGRNYQLLEQSLDRLRNLTIKAQGAFWDNERQQHTRTLMSFNLLDKYWIRARESNQDVLQREDCQAYIIWGEDIHRSFRSGYLKPLNITFYLGLDKPVTRTLYRFLDKRLRNRDAFEIDIFDLASRIGLASYEYPAHIRRRIKPACDELISRGFLEVAKRVKVGKYTRMRFVKTGAEAALIQNTEAPMVQMLTAYGITRAKAEGLARGFTKAKIEEKIELLEWKRDPESKAGGRPVTNPAAWLVRAIENDFSPPAGFSSRKDREDLESQRVQEIDRVLEAQAAAREEVLKEREKVRSQIMEKYGTSEREFGLWKVICAELQLRIPQATYESWISRTQLLSLSGEVALIAVPSERHGDWIENRLDDVIRDLLDCKAEVSVDLSFEVIDGYVLEMLSTGSV